MKHYLEYLKKHYSTFFLFKLILSITFLVVITDYLNFPTKLLEITGTKFFIFLFVVLIIFLTLFVLEWRVYEVFKIQSINFLDALLLSMFFGSIFYLISILFLGNLTIYKLISIPISVVLFLVLSINRIVKFNSLINMNQQRNYMSNIIDFREIYTNDFEISKEHSVLVDEKDVQYDLLGRDHIIDLLSTSILNINPSTSFVISLEGKWGSGKTTILNNTKRKIRESTNKNTEKIIIIDDLDPWSYETPESLFHSMFNRILMESKIEFNSFEMTQIINQFYSEIFSNKKVNTLKSIVFPNKTLEEIKQKINDHLILSDKKVVFFIDNIDRAGKENIILLFKLVGNILDFKKIVYVLSFDNERVKKVTEDDLNIDYEFIKKIVQMKVNVPLIDKKIYRELIETSISNILLKYNELDITSSNESSYEIVESHAALIKFMTHNTNDLRDFKIFINSALNFSFTKMSFLNKRDLLVIEYIRLNNLTLYQEIYHNEHYFTSRDYEVSLSFYTARVSLNNKEFEKELTNYYDSIFSTQENSKFIDLLGVIFPYVDNYQKIKNTTLKSSIINNNIPFEAINKRKYIFSPKFFSLYFTYKDNIFVEISRLIETFIKSTNQEPHKIDELFDEFLTSLSEQSHIDTLITTLENYVSDIDSKNRHSMLKTFYSHLQRFDPTQGHHGSDVQYRLVILISRILEIIDEDHFVDYSNYIRQDYGRIKNISEITRTLSNFTQNQDFIHRDELLTEALSFLKNSIIDKKVDLYSDDYYQMWNIRVVKDLSIKDENISKFKEYITWLLNESNIFKFLWDITSVSYNSNEVRYYIQEKKISDYTTKEHINNIISKIEPSNENEKLLLKFFENLIPLNEDDDFNIDRGMVFSKFLQMKL